jgi:parallel beta-helix repeat protein
MRNRVTSVLATAWVAGAAAVAGPSEAATYFASPNGNDLNPGTSARPVRTLQRAKKLLKAGDTVLIADGEYPGGVNQNVDGAPGMPITYKAINPGRVILRGDQTTLGDVFTVRDANWVVVDGLTFQDGGRVGIFVANSNNVVVRNCFAFRNGVTGIFSGYSDDLLIENNESAFTVEQHGIYVSNSGDRPVVRYNVSHDNGRCGIQLNGDGKQLKPPLGTRGDGIIESAVVDSNIIYNNGEEGGAGINLFSVRDSKISNNLIFNNVAGGISLFNDNNKYNLQWGSKNNLIVSNTIYFRRLEGRWCISLTNGCTDNVIANNILSGGARGAYQYDDTSSFESDHNLIYSAKSAYAAVYTVTGKMQTATEYQNKTGNDTHSVYADPKFVDPAGTKPDFHLKADSPARKAGVSLQQVTADADGSSTPDGIRPDLGCYGGAVAASDVAD